MCLLFLLHEKEEEYRIRLRAVHVMHRIRGLEAEEDAKLCRSLCDRLGIPLKVADMDVPALARREGIGLEEAGRMARLRVFEETDADRIALAHHAEDSAETVLFNLFRGSGMQGLSGIAPVSGRIIRPLLRARRREIEEYLEERNIPYCMDSTNADVAYARNRIRQNILKEAEKVNSDAIGHITGFAEALREEGDFLERLSQEEGRRYVEDHGMLGCSIRVEAFMDCDPVITSRMIRAMFLSQAGKLKDLTRRHIRLVAELACGISGKRADLPYGFVAEREFDRIWIRRKEGLDEKTGEEYRLSEVMGKGGWLRLPDERLYRMWTAEAPEWEDGCKWCFDYDRIQGSAVFRTRRPGDRIRIRGGTKKLKDVLIEEKVPKRERERLYVLAEGSSIIWMPGGRIGEDYRITAATKRILVISTKGGA